MEYGSDRGMDRIRLNLGRKKADHQHSQCSFTDHVSGSVSKQGRFKCDGGRKSRPNQFALFTPSVKFMRGLAKCMCQCFMLNVRPFLLRCMECRRGLAMKFLSDCLSVRLSVCPSVKRVHCDKTEEKSVQIFYTMRQIIQSSFLRRRMVGGGRPLLPEILGQPARVGAKSPPILNR